MPSCRRSVSDLVVNMRLYRYDTGLLGLTLQYKLCGVQMQRHFDEFRQHIRTVLTKMQLPPQAKTDFLKQLDVYQWHPFMAVSSSELQIAQHENHLCRGAVLRRAILSTLDELSTNPFIRQSYVTFKQAQQEAIATENRLKQRLLLVSKHLEK